MEQNKIKTGFRDFDNITDGFEKSDLIYVASRPNMGKSTFALNIALNTALQKIPTFLFSLELSKEQVVNEMMNIECAISHNFLENARNLILLQENVYIYDNVIQDITILEQTAKKAKLQENIGLIIIDYLELVDFDRTLEEKLIRLKIFAKELNVPIIILSNLSQDLELREDKRPVLSDFTYTSSIVNYADTIIFLYRDDYYNTDIKQYNRYTVTEFIIAKNKRGGIGTVKLLYNNKRYINIDEEHNRR